MSDDDEHQITSPGYGRLGAGNGRASIGECRGRGIGWGRWRRGNRNVDGAELRPREWIELFDRQPKVGEAEYQIGYNQANDYAKQSQHERRHMRAMVGFYCWLKVPGAQLFHGTASSDAVQRRVHDESRFGSGTRHTDGEAAPWRPKLIEAKLRLL